MRTVAELPNGAVSPLSPATEEGILRAETTTGYGQTVEPRPVGRVMVKRRSG